ncbi:MAG: sulfotransferase domain-containing protein [Phycisphaeraceae bacterium]|nr:sulfotransferase domain-containing protein [Phycisphaeraceae bacterium]
MASIGSDNIGRTAVRRWRLLSAGLRVLPDFLIIGAMKSGTSSLFHYLTQHPELVPAFEKEIHYFDQDEASFGGRTGALAWYRSHFPIKAMIPSRSLVYEATPKYLCHETAARRIAAVVPNARLVLTLRNPSDRAISHYFHTRCNPPDPESLHAAMCEDLARCASLGVTGGDASGTPDYTSCVGRGVYRPQIERYLERFDRQDLHVIDSERFFEDPGPVLSSLFEFLGVRADVPIRDLAARNVSKRDKQVWPRTRALLDDYFRPHNERLFELLGERYDWNDADSSSTGSE